MDMDDFKEQMLTADNLSPGTQIGKEVLAMVGASEAMTLNIIGIEVQSELHMLDFLAGAIQQVHDTSVEAHGDGAWFECDADACALARNMLLPARATIEAMAEVLTERGVNYLAQQEPEPDALMN